MRAECLAAVLSIAASHGAAAASYRFQPLAAVAKLGGFTPVTISDDGQVAGTLQLADGSGSLALFTDGRSMSTADFCGTHGASDVTVLTATSPYSMSRFMAGDCRGEGFLYHAPTKALTAIGTPNFAGVNVSAVGPNGVVAGIYNEHSGGDTGFIEKGGVYTSFSIGDFTFTQGINLRGTLYGSAFSLNGFESGFLRHPDGRVATIDWPTADYSTVVTGLNGSGQAVGYFYYTFGTNNPNHAFLWQKKRFAQPLLLRAASSIASAIDEAGDVAGVYLDGAGKPHGFVWRSASGHMMGFDPPAAASSLTIASINNHAAVAGYYTVPQGRKAPKIIAFIARCAGVGCP